MPPILESQEKKIKYLLTSKIKCFILISQLHEMSQISKIILKLKMNA